MYILVFFKYVDLNSKKSYIITSLKCNYKKFYCILTKFVITLKSENY